MKKLFFILLLLCPFFLVAQTGNTNNNNNNNPYGSHPYQNPFEGPYSTPSYPSSDKKENDDKKGNSTNGNSINNNNVNTFNKNDISNQLQDMNQSNLELYRNDPDYIRYLTGKLDNEKYEEMLELKEKQRKDTLIAEIKDTSKKIYGANFFQNNNIFELSDKSSTTPPLDYRLGPGDELIVSVWGGSELQQTYTIAKDGSIFPKLVGKIYVQGLTLEAASRIIRLKFNKVFSSSSIDVQVGKVKTIRITILGEVKKQGTITISAYNTALNALFKAGGLTSLGNMRKIEVKRDGRTVDVIDLYQYLQSGKNAEEVYLEDNDYIYVDVYDKVVKADGMFKRPMYYQLIGDEGLKDLIHYSGGASSNSRNSMIHIKTVVNEEESIVNIEGNKYFDENSYDDYVLKDGDVVSIKPINEGLRNVVKVEGAVNYPDDYQIIEGRDYLKDVIKRAGGLQGNAYKAKAFIFRGGNQIDANAIKVDLNDLQEDRTSIVTGDRIKILSEKSFEEKYQIEVIGNVRKPSKIPYYKNLKLKDALLLAGGLTLDAENGRIEISSIVDSIDKYSITNKNGVNIKVISINANLELDEVSEEIILKPLDRIYVRKKVEFLPQERIMLLGEISYAGEYVLLNKNEKISSVLKRAGGILPTAYPEGAKLIRKKIGQIVIDLPEILSQKSSKYDIVLQDSDIIIIPTINDIVSVKGEVQSNVNIKYDRGFNDVNYYIGAAGGYGERPWRRRINVKDQNGRIKKTKNFLFIHIHPKVKAGSTVNVPTKPIKTDKTKFSEVFAGVTGTLTSLATLFILGKSAGIFK